MNFLPFGYLWLIKKNLEKENIKTILDLGCGKGDFGVFFNENNKYEITGLEIYDPYLKITRQTKKYKNLISADLTKKLKFKDKSFDAVVCLQVIEHLKKSEGQELLSEAQRVAKKMVLFTTPVGECEQEAYDKNDYQKHHSAWLPEEFKKMGYKVFGVSLKLAFGSHSHAHTKLTGLIIPRAIISFLLNPLTNLLPEIAAQMIAVKNLKVRRSSK